MGDHDGKTNESTETLQPLDGYVRIALETSRKNSMLVLGKWLIGEISINTDESTEELIPDWLAGLTVKKVEEMFHTITRLIGRHILNSGQDTAEIKSVNTTPYLQVMAMEGSLLAQDNGFEKTDNVRVHEMVFVHRISSHCDVSTNDAFLAWRFITTSLPVLSDLLPGLDAKYSPDLDIIELTIHKDQPSAEFDVLPAGEPLQTDKPKLECD